MAFWRRRLALPSIAAGLLIAGSSATAQVPGYGGPSILRGARTQPGTASSPFLRIRPFASISAGYEWGLTPVQLDEEGRLPNLESATAFATFGVNGVHAWKRASLGVSYQGRGRVYSRNTRLNGLDHTLSLGWVHQVTPRVTYSLTQTAGLFNRGVGLQGANFGTTGNIGLLPGNLVTDLAPVGEDDLLDTRTYYLASVGTVVYQPGARWSFGGGGGAFLIRRRAPGLAGVNGYVAFTGAGYALSRRTSVGVNYSFGRYDFTRAFGEAKVHTLTAFVTRTLSRRWAASVYAGGFRLEREQIIRVSLDPVIAAILGQTTGHEIFRGNNHGSAAGVNLNGNFRRSQLVLNYQRGVVPGNGLFIGGRNDRVAAWYSYNGFQEWSVRWGAAYGRTSALNQTGAQAVENYIANMSVGRRITRWLHFGASGAFRRVEIPNTYHRSSAMAMVGLVFAPGDYPVSFW